MDLFKILNVLKAGNRLKNPQTWKKGQQLTNAVGGILVVILNLAMPEHTLSEEFVNSITAAITSIMIAVNLYLTPATTNKISATGKARSKDKE